MSDITSKRWENQIIIYSKLDTKTCVDLMATEALGGERRRMAVSEVANGMNTSSFLVPRIFVFSLAMVVP